MMNETVTVEDAIWKGHKTITVPSIITMLSGPVTLIALSKKLEYPGWIFFVVVLIFIALAWLIWSVQVTKWKVWAFENVTNVHELEKQAIKSKLIWPAGSIFNKTEVWSAHNKAKWEALQARFSIVDEFIPEEDPTVPYETIVPFSNAVKYLGVLGGLISIGVSVYIFMTRDTWTSLFVGAAGVYFIVKNMREVKKWLPPIILNEEGMQAAEIPFYKWEDIHGEYIEGDVYDATAECYLVFKHPGGIERIRLDYYDLSSLQIRKLLKVYRSRYLRKKGSVNA
ncbi:MAG: hypothetical protein JST82_01170 [Bacteroidetes bacterium]|nr:hypothetical protein [Bacteroidota bacterium]